MVFNLREVTGVKPEIGCRSQRERQGIDLGPRDVLVNVGEDPEASYDKREAREAKP